MGVGGQRHGPSALPAGERPRTRCTVGWVGPSAGLDGCGKPRLHRVDSRTVQPVATELSRPIEWGKNKVMRISRQPSPTQIITLAKVNNMLPKDGC
jgi:hypothetical protein